MTAPAPGTKREVGSFTMSSGPTPLPLPLQLAAPDLEEDSAPGRVMRAVRRSEQMQMGAVSDPGGGYASSTCSSLDIQRRPGPGSVGSSIGSRRRRGRIARIGELLDPRGLPRRVRNLSTEVMYMDMFQSLLPREAIEEIVEEVKEEQEHGSSAIAAVDAVAKRHVRDLAASDVSKFCLVAAAGATACCGAIGAAKWLLRAFVRPLRVGPLKVGAPLVAVAHLVPTGAYGALLAAYFLVHGAQGAMERLREDDARERQLQEQQQVQQQRPTRVHHHHIRPAQLRHRHHHHHNNTTLADAALGGGGAGRRRVRPRASSNATDEDAMSGELSPVASQPELSRLHRLPSGTGGCRITIKAALSLDEASAEEDGGPASAGATGGNSGAGQQAGGVQAGRPVPEGCAECCSGSGAASPPELPPPPAEGMARRVSSGSLADERGGDGGGAVSAGCTGGSAGAGAGAGNEGAGMQAGCPDGVSAEMERPERAAFEGSSPASPGTPPPAPAPAPAGAARAGQPLAAGINHTVAVEGGEPDSPGAEGAEAAAAAPKPAGGAAVIYAAATAEMAMDGSVAPVKGVGATETPPSQLLIS